MQKISTSLALAAVLLLLASCGKHSFFEEDGGGVVGPLLQTKWNQVPPYNNLFPIGDNGRPVIAGCGNIAMAQLIAFHRHPARGKGESGPTQVRFRDVPSVNFEIDYDWDNILNTYPNANSGTEEEQNPVAITILIITNTSLST